MAYGYNGKVLRVNLTEGRTSVEEPDPRIYRRYLGGGALASYYLLKEMRPGVDALGPENKLVFAASVITGSAVAGASRFSVAAKSPLTGGYGEAEAGGFWGPELKFAGFDVVIVEGRAPRPMYLWISDGRVEIREASHLWGRSTGEVEDAIRQELGDQRVRVAQIGPAGERLVRYACILNNRKHVNGRTGMGAVMGSKNLRAVAVRGSGRPEFHDDAGMKAIVQWFADTWESNIAQRDMHVHGTAGYVLPLDAVGMLPTRNFKSGTFEGASDISGEAMAETILVEREGCYACPVRCKRVVDVKEPYVVDSNYGGPEYETIAGLGSSCGIRDLKAIAKGNELCNKYGMDTISTGMTIAFAMECYENGILDKHDTGGLELHFGDAGVMLVLVELIAKREGIGDLLAEGSMRAAERIGRGAEKHAMHVKGQELPLHEPRGKSSVALAYAVSPTGADHMEAPHDPDFAQEGASLDSVAPLGILEPLPAIDFSDAKVRMFAYLQRVWSLYNSLGLCVFVTSPPWVLSLSKMVELVRAATGWDTSLWELLKVGERANNLARVFNVREGLAKENDVLPERLFEPLEGGALRGVALKRDDFERALLSYYRMVGWDSQTGVPSKERLEEIDIGWTWDLVKDRAT